jgi:hypothetical protein
MFPMLRSLKHVEILLEKKEPFFYKYSFFYIEILNGFARAANAEAAYSHRRQPNVIN